MASIRAVRKRLGLLWPAIVAPLVACQLIAGLGDDLTDGSSVTNRAPDAALPDGATKTDDGSVGAYEATVLADKPVAYYRFAETTGALCKDSSGNGNDANLTGKVVRDHPGVVADVASKSVGLGQGATLPLDPKFDFGLTQEITFEFWFRGNFDGGGGELFGNRSWDTVAQANNGTVLFFIDVGTGFERWSVTQPGQPLAYAHTKTPLQPGPGGVVHFAVVNGSAGPTVYINGTAYQGGLNPNPIDASVLNGSLVLGREVPGDFGELAIYDKALSADRIAAHYSAGEMK